MKGFTSKEKMFEKHQINTDNTNEINDHLLRATYVSKSSCCRNPER